MTVLYGSSLPPEFFEMTKKDFPFEVDLLIVAGTSLTVGPANQVPTMVQPNTPRLIVNKDAVGREFGISYDPKSPKNDVHYAGECDAGFMELVVELEWFDELEKYAEHMCEASQQLIRETRAKLQSTHD